MDAEKLNQELYDKMAAEQKEYRSWLLEQTPEEILNHAYEYAMREDILMEMEELDLSAPETAALLESHSPLADIYKDFRDIETGHMDHLLDCIKERADRLLKTQTANLLKAKQEATRAIPLYPHSGEYASEHGELHIYRASRRANFACRSAIEKALLANSDRMCLPPDAPKDILAEFGPERVTYVLAATLLDKAGDRRFSHDNMEWAASVPMLDIGNKSYTCNLYNNPRDLNRFVTLVREEMDTMMKQTEKKPSIKAQLAAKPTPSDQSAKPKDREVR